MRCRTFHMILFCSFFCSCTLFNTREPENPVSDNQTLPDAKTAGELFGNLKTSIEQKNILEYTKLFSDSVIHQRMFVFVPTQTAGSRYGVIFSAWDKNAEAEYFRNAVTSVGASSSPQFQTSSLSVVTFQSDSAQYTFDYLLFFPHHRSDVKTQQFVGRSEIMMSQDKNFTWRIYRWIDFETKRDSSWSDLKGQFAK